MCEKKERIALNPVWLPIATWKQVLQVDVLVRPATSSGGNNLSMCGGKTPNREYGCPQSFPVPIPMGPLIEVRLFGFVHRARSNGFSGTWEAAVQLQVIRRSGMAIRPTCEESRRFSDL